MLAKGMVDSWSPLSGQISIHWGLIGLSDQLIDGWVVQNGVDK